MRLNKRRPGHSWWPDTGVVRLWAPRIRTADTGPGQYCVLFQVVPGHTQMPGQVFQFGPVARQGHRQADSLSGRFALQLAEQPAGDAAHAGYLADTKMADLPAVLVALHDGCGQQAGIEACANHMAMGQVILQQDSGVGIGSQ